MFKTIRICVCDFCKQQLTEPITRIVFTQINENESPIANSQYDGMGPIDVCPNCIAELQNYVRNDLMR